MFLHFLRGALSYFLLLQTFVQAMNCVDLRVVMATEAVHSDLITVHLNLFFIFFWSTFGGFQLIMELETPISFRQSRQMTG